MRNAESEEKIGREKLKVREQERERERETEREREKETVREGERDTERGRKRQRERERMVLIHQMFPLMLHLLLLLSDLFFFLKINCSRG